MLKLKNISILLFLNCILVCFSVAQAAEQLKPEQVANLYLNAFINGDVASANRLNGYIQSEFSSKEDAINIVTVRDLVDDVAYRIPNRKWGGFLSTLSYNDMKLLGPEIEYFFKSIAGALVRSECRATSSEKDERASFGGQHVVAVHFVCSVPNINPDMAELEKLVANGQPDVKKVKQALQDLTADVVNAPVNKVVNGQLRLSHLDKESWYNALKGKASESRGEDNLDKGIWYASELEGLALIETVLSAIEND